MAGNGAREEFAFASGDYYNMVAPRSLGQLLSREVGAWAPWRERDSTASPRQVHNQRRWHQVSRFWIGCGAFASLWWCKAARLDHGREGSAGAMQNTTLETGQLSVGCWIAVGARFRQITASLSCKAGSSLRKLWQVDGERGVVRRRCGSVRASASTQRAKPSGVSPCTVRRGCERNAARRKCCGRGAWPNVGGLAFRELTYSSMSPRMRKLTAA